ncbi:MAG: phosphoribosylanthranilate isomerase [Cytophagales bacterium]|nr:phosphoribosylanthranilate isomerase [Bernardetiaceae bacterium]MDW8204393.1 phosphoribosylanthranilate isomerase [Cytophagales bacterium]
MQWKICGLKDPANMVSILEKVQPHYVGLIFYSGSPRFAGTLAPQELPAFPAQTKKVGVFVNSSAAAIGELVARYNLQLLQLHGSESPEVCYHIRQQTQLPIIKAFAVGQTFDFSQLAAYEQVVDFFLFDTKGSNHGGNGVVFNWELLQQYAFSTPFFLSGGIGIEHAEAIAKLQLPQLHAIDVNSRFETAPGIKNVSLLCEFKTQLCL